MNAMKTMKIHSFIASLFSMFPLLTLEGLSLYIYIYISLSLLSDPDRVPLRTRPTHTFMKSWRHNPLLQSPPDSLEEAHLEAH